ATNNIQQEERQIRNQVYHYLTAEEAKDGGLEKDIVSYVPNQLHYDDVNCGGAIQNTITREGGIRKAHHISEITATQVGGARYVYGIPAYNKMQKEATFNVTPSANVNDELVSYTAGQDNSTNNNKGYDHFFDAQTIPAYAHSYLLTGVLSPDYVDRTGDGITDDDLGNAVKINYSRIYDDGGNSYHWRVPVEQNKARYQAGYESKSDDDKGTYLYGEKEVWYTHSIESRNMVAQFYISDRIDSYGVQGENGGMNSNRPLKKLDKISLYAKADLINNGADAVPIKTVHFEYDYDLCQGLPNQMSNNGKLTLKKIYFTYGNNQRGQLNAYKFGYNAFNPNYNIANYDRWGGFKSKPQNGQSFQNDNYPTSDFPANKDFPYVLQDEALSNRYAQAWNLSQIDLPSGGQINIEYESDDYAYVQNKRAGQMLFIKGFSDQNNGSAISSNLYRDRGNKIHNYLIVDLVESISSGTVQERKDELQTRYFEDVKDDLYFQCKVRLKDSESQYDYIKGYLEYEDIHPIGTTQMAIKVKLLTSNGKSIHPISKATFQALRLTFPELVYPGYNTNANPSEIFKG
ncbi:MAG: hypothetical protein AAFP82_22260, partial [Bacteroidota bacterium]